jgi:glyceraldehyde 3-phosphate dehydrogenase
MIQFTDVLMEQLVKRPTFVNGKKHSDCRKNPLTWKWNEVDVDVVANALVSLQLKKQANAHIIGGAKKVITAPSADAPILVMGVNHDKALLVTR